jgi:hypothetical protein
MIRPLVVALLLSHSLLWAQQPVSVPACPAPAIGASQRSWVRAVTSDSILLIDIPRAYWKDGRNNQWSTDVRAPNARWFGLARTTGVTADAGQWVPAGDTANKATDVEYVSHHSACREAIHGVAALIESGLLAGTNQPAVRVVWYNGHQPVAIMIGGARDAAGQAELLAIARTVRFRR